MDLRKLLSLIIDSSREDWNYIGGESTFHSKFGLEGPPLTLHAYSHTSLAAYIPDASITMEWGLKFNEDYRAEWVKRFPDPHAFGNYLDVFFNSALVYRSPFVSVDGGLIKLPLPNNDIDLKVERVIAI